MVRIVQMTAYDYNTLAPLFADMHAESKYADQPMDDKVVRGNFAGVGEHVGGFIAYSGDEPIGFCAAMLTEYFFRSGRIAVDMGVYVAKDYRHTTAFPLLLRHLERWAKNKGADALICGITAPRDVDRVKRVYEKLGYTELGVSMRKEL